MDAIPDYSVASTNQVMAIQGDGSIAWDDQTGSSGIYIYETKTANFDAVEDYGYYIDIATAGGDITATLPASPSVDDMIRFIDVSQSFSTYGLVLNRNGNKIMGLTENFTANQSNFSFTIIYTGTTYGWVVF